MHVASKTLFLRHSLERLPFRPISLTEYRFFRLRHPDLRMDIFFREAIHERFRKLSQLPYLKRMEHLNAYVAKTHNKLV